MRGFWRNLVGQSQLQLSLAVDSEGVGKIRGVVRLVIVVAVVTQQGADTLTFGINVCHYEGITTMYEGIVKSGVNHTVSFSRIPQIGYAVDIVQATRNDGIAYLGLFGVLLGDGLVFDASVEVTVVA